MFKFLLKTISVLILFNQTKAQISLAGNLDLLCGCIPINTTQIILSGKNISSVDSAL